MHTQEQNTTTRIQAAKPSLQWCVQFSGSFFGYSHDLLENPN
jgi:hypothetical protein